MEKALGWTNFSFPVTVRAYVREGEKLFKRACSGQEVMAINWMTGSDEILEKNS